VAANVVDHNKIIFAQPGGPGGVAEGIRMLLVAFPDLSASIERLVGEEDYVVAKVRMAGTNTGAYPRVPEPTGRHTVWDSMILFRIEALVFALGFVAAASRVLQLRGQGG
jgi:predicted ester cyclase